MNYNLRESGLATDKSSVGLSEGNSASSFESCQSTCSCQLSDKKDTI